MITYPQHPRRVRDAASRSSARWCTSHGGQVYVDGANMNALVGVAAPGEFGGDVSHLNLHKTFCIPHGGGGPGVGPVCVVADLVPFLPGHAHRPASPASAASAPCRPRRWATPAVLPISWMYCRMMGADGLQRGHRGGDPRRQLHRRAAARPLPHALRASRRSGRVAHECILDLRPLKETSGVTRRGRGQAADRLRLPRADAELPGAGHADGRADRERAARRARPLLSTR